MPMSAPEARKSAPLRHELEPPSVFGMELHPDAVALSKDSAALCDAYGGNGIRVIFKNYMVALCASCACAGGLLFGFDQGLLSVTLVMPQFLAQFPEIDTSVTSGAGLNKGVMTALLELGAFIGALLAGFFADRYSRRASIGLGLVWFVIGSIIQTTSFQFAQLLVGRFIGGVGIGLLSSTAPMYISEISPPNVRGAFLVLSDGAIVFGIVVMFYLTYGTRYIASDWCFRLPFLIQITPAFGLAVALYFLPFSPRWLAGKGRDKEALHSLSRLRRLPVTDPRVQAEWLNIRAEACHNREVLVASHPDKLGEGFAQQLKLEVASWLDMLKPGIRRRTMIGVVMMFFQQFVGINALIYYSPTLFEQLGLGYDMQLTLSGVMNVVQFVALIPTFLWLDKVGRRPPLLVGSVGMTICHFVVAAMIAKYPNDWPAHQAQAWVGVAFIIFYMVPYGVGWGPIPWSLPAEVHAASRRAKGLALTTCSNWGNNFIIGLITPPLVQNTGYGAFIFFGVFSVLSGVWAYFFVPETKGIALEDIDRIFGDHMAHQDMEEKLKIVDIISGGPAPAEVLEVPEKGSGSRKSSEAGLEARSGLGSSGSSTWAK
ncbi:hypothetical protein JCM24511_09102 [Saitozyma sp. JCM 24511]|nr:hypothetical protein JCM24511_09102 [Saitozyma sp. JCM 24511]